MRVTPGAFPIVGAPQHSHRPIGHAHFWERALSRRQIITTAAGGTAVALGAGLWMPGLAQAAQKAASDPKPIPLTLDGTPFHVLLPGPGVEQSTITDLNGFVGVAAITGTGTDGLTFDTDLRFMQGVYVGVDERVHRGTFGFVWLDIYVGAVSAGDQIHDFDPGIHPFPHGVFWTVRIPDESVTVNLDAGTASIRVSDLEIEDYFNIPNALSDGPSVDATVSYEFHWSGVTSQSHVRNEAQGYAGLFLQTGATARWTGQNANGFQYASSDSGQTVNFAQIGHERNGVFFS